MPVLHWGAGWIAVDKPAGLSVHNDPGGDLCTLMERFIRVKCRNLAVPVIDFGFGLHAVHRLDKETSGIVLLAGERDTFRYLSAQFTSGQITKHYLALVHGLLAAPAGPDPWGCWDRPLAAKAQGRRDPQGPGPRSAATTLFRVLDGSRRYTLIECRILTGRTHQIRRHAALEGHAVVGDRRYGSLRACRYLQQHHSFTRLALHAAQLGFRVPDREDPLLIVSPKLPRQIDALMKGRSENGFEHRP